MSMVIKEEEGRIEKLENFLNDAFSKKIVFIGSTEDMASHTVPSFPASCDNVISIAACDAFGNLLGLADERANYYFQGDRVSVKSSLGREDEVSGSSVATAVASRVAGLALALTRYAGVGNSGLPVKADRNIFERMAKDTGKFVQPNKVFTADTKSPETHVSRKWDSRSLMDWAKHEFLDL